jgi:hypothetical protein
MLIVLGSSEPTALECHNEAERTSRAKRLQQAREHEIMLKANQERIAEAIAKRARKASRRSESQFLTAQTVL